MACTCTEAIMIITSLERFSGKPCTGRFYLPAPFTLHFTAFYLLILNAALDVDRFSM